MTGQSSKVDWSQTDTYLNGNYSPYNLYGLRGSSGSQIVQWWPGDASHEPAKRQSSRLDTVATWLFMVITLLAIVQFLVPEKSVPGFLRGIYQVVVLPGAALYWLWLAAFLVGGVLWALKTNLFPTQKDLAERQKVREDREWRDRVRTITVVLKLGELGQHDQTTPLKMNRDRNSAPLNADTLPRDRLIYVTLHDLSDEAYAELSKRLGFMVE